MLIFTERQWRVFNRIRRKYKVSLEFLKYNMPNILKFIAYYGRRLHFVLKCSAERSPRNRSVVIKYNCLTRSIFDEAHRKRIKRRKRNIKQWSKRMVLYLRKTKGVKEYIIINKLRNSVQNPILPEDLTKQLKEQLELLKTGKRSTQLMECSLSEAEVKSGNASLEITETFTENPLDESCRKDMEKQQNPGEFILNERTGVLESNIKGISSTLNDNSRIANVICTPENTKSSANILDVLMSKVRGSQTMPTVKSVSTTSLPNVSSENDTGVDSGEEFLGFAEDESIPGLMRTPLVPSIFRSKEESSAFVSEALDEYFRENSLNWSVDIEQLDTVPSNRKLRQANIDGLMTLNSKPPAFEMPAVPESLQKLRTVAERRHFLQKFSKNVKLAIINNEAAIYRDLQRKIRQPKIKLNSQQAMQAKSSQMSFTRQGWQAASFVTTELNRFYFQKLFIPDEKKFVELHGVRGNNTDQYKAPYVNKIKPQTTLKCTKTCIDCCIAKGLKPISTYANRKKLCKDPFRPIFKPCPLSEKPRQPLLDDDEIMLNGGGMTVVRLPTIQLEVHPELGKSLNDVAKRYLEYILPNEGITREWAEFSTSTLQIPSQARSKNQKNIRSFTFAMPYVNDRSHILVRRIVDRSEKIDPHFLCSSDEKNWSGLSFCANIDKTDSTKVECASLLADMINAVTISCSENSFIKDDIEALNKDYHYNSILSKEKFRGRPKLPETQKTISASKKSRLITELRRLNATIIETNAQHKNDNQHCVKEFCALGCICPSLNNGYPLQQHCGKPKCMLQCVCKGSTPSKILRIETDGRSITTEDAYNMRLQATARLARIEKEFTSTIVVTENETLLINETEYDKKRRCTKVPKRYQDYRDTDSEFGRISPVKSCSTASPFDANESRISSTATISEVMAGLQEPIYVKDTVLKQLKHCSIPLIPFKDTHNMAVWCMIHQMYKCFCGGQALEGKRLVIEKEDIKSVSGIDTDVNIKPKYSSKAYYSFESIEEDMNQSVTCSTLTKRKNSEDRKSVVYEKAVDMKRKNSEDHKSVISEKAVDTKQKNSEDRKVVTFEKAGDIEKLPRQIVEHHFLKNFFNDRDYLGCSRFIPVPSRTYTTINRKRHNKTLEEIKHSEDTKSQLLLNEHIMRSVYYHKEKVEPEKIKQETPEFSTIKQEKCLEKMREGSKSTISAEMEFLEDSVTEQSDMKEDRITKKLQASGNNFKRTEKGEKNKESGHQSLENKVKKSRKDQNNKDSELRKPKRSIMPYDDIQPEEKKLKRREKDEKNEKNEPEKPKRSFAPIEDVQPAEKKLKKSEKLESSEHPKSKDSSFSELNKKDMSATEDNVSLPRISGCYSAHSQNERRGNQNLDISADEGVSSFSEDLRENYNEVIRMLNSLVSRKMHDIDNALKRDSKIVPPPTENVLCVLQWKNFLGAFQDGLIYIWEVKMKTRTFLAATVQNIIPMVLGALAVISITQTPLQQLPLIGQMILQGFKVDESNNLAVIMQGRSHYWFIKGFLQPNGANACLRPTPETHPELTKKINTLCSSLIKQRTRELQRREAQLKRKITKGIGESQSNINDTPSYGVQQQNQLGSLLLSSPSSSNNATNHPSPDENPEHEKIKMFDALNSKKNNWVSNIAVHNPVSLDAEKIQIPEFHENDHSWYVLELCNDFSHIFVPTQKEIISLDRIQRLIALSIDKQKMIRIQFLKRACFDAFIIPSSKRKIYFGPFPVNAEPPLLVLLQSVDGKMMTREAYQKMHNIQCKSTQTVSFWLKQINGKICFDEPDTESESETCERKGIESSGSQLIANPVQTPNSGVTNLNEDCEDDCIIIENENDFAKQPHISNLPALSKHIQELKTKYLGQNSQVPKNVVSLQHSTLSIPENNTTFDINTLNPRNKFESIVLDGSKKTNESLIPTANLRKDLDAQQTSLGQIRLEPRINYNTQPLCTTAQLECESYINNFSIPSTSVRTEQVGSAESIEPTIIKHIPTMLKTSSYPYKAVQLPKVTENELKNPSTKGHSLEDVQQTVIITNRLASAVSKSTNNNLHPPSTVIASKLIKITPISVQSINTSASNNITRTTTTTTTKTATTTTSYLTSGTVITTVSPGIKCVSDNILKYNIPRTSVTESRSLAIAPQATISSPSILTSTSSPISAPTASIGKNITVNRLSSGIIKIPQNAINSAKITTSPTSAIGSTQNSSSALLKLLKKPTPNVQQATLLTSKTTTVAAREKPTSMNYTTAKVKDVTKTPLNLYRIPQTTTTSSPDVSPWPVKLSTVVSQSGRLIGKPQSTLVSPSPNSVPISCSPNKIAQNEEKKTIKSYYGYLCSNIPGAPRFSAKRTQFEYLIKIPECGLARVNGIVKANSFLNKYVAKNFPLFNQKHIWTFIPQKNTNHNAQNTSPIPQIPQADREKNKAPIPHRTSAIASKKPNFTFHQINQPTSKIENNFTFTNLLNSVNETILIDDDDD